jgi:hypothetical protein
MADITGVTSLLATASETYTNNLSASISAGAGTVPVNANTEYTDGQVAVLTVDAGTASEATFTGIKASTPARFTNCIWTEGNTGVGHSSGATIVDYDSATHFNMLSTNVQAHANQDGTLKTSAVQAALNISAAVPSDYTSLAQTMTTVVANGNRSYTGTFPAVDYSDRLSAGKRLRTVRSVAAPTQCATFDGTNDYFSKTTPAGMTFTDDFVAGAWVKLSSYVSGDVISRFNLTSGWRLLVGSTGQVTLIGYNASSSNYSQVSSYQSLPLNKWVYVSAQLDMSAFTATTTTSYVMFDGVDVPSLVQRGGTNPTALVQAGNLEVGSFNASSFFNGKIAQAFVSSAKITQANVRTLMTQGLTPALITSNNIISAYSLDNSLTDLNTTSANNLTANGGVLATTADSPFGGQADGTISTTVDYGIIQKVSYGAPDTTVTFQVPEGCTVPTSGGVASVSYSAYKSPYGFPGDTDKWTLSIPFFISLGQVAPAAATVYNPGGFFLTAPAGKHVITYKVNIYANRAAGGIVNILFGLGTSTITNPVLDSQTGQYNNGVGQDNTIPATSPEIAIDNSAQQLYYVQMSTPYAGLSAMSLRGEIGMGMCIFKIKNAYL